MRIIQINEWKKSKPGKLKEHLQFIFKRKKNKCNGEIDRKCSKETCIITNVSHQLDEHLVGEIIIKVIIIIQSTAGIKMRIDVV